ncbi:hypothetical protein [Paenibacillus mucilaginosus]|uniref:PPM-type phosphatase domain-containing protein n=1 Tax=Paenibacillus mucilaginosus (strain KNP414) TaxID=1036673 RepID=F8FP72_PAEMK|nr:hypothetical protein [Paenibacillus mucilaginosus]AEI39022.1 hypothetical protein KNP414_00397 [Paenibacillus mucilaginosus KNP414]MCG7216156.1 hypothetical protein [Paenibacillus mucilaginosus]WDM28060.1 hypothetical protein KCX80_01900 [Paenibacillus mucilaginosus]
MNTYEYRLDPTEDVPLTTVVVGPALYRFAARRADESLLAGEPSQDDLVLRADETGASFCICDGVSLSFFGGLAARLLGDALLEWCASGIPAKAGEPQVRLSLERLLADLTHTAGEAVRSHPLPNSAAGLLREVLEDKRRLGSEAMFVFGRVDFPCTAYPAGRLVLGRMGDIRIRFAAADGQWESSLTGFTEQRWSTRRGAVGGRPAVLITELPAAGSGLTVYTDGWAAFCDGVTTLPPEGPDPWCAARDGEELPADDDQLFFQMQWQMEPPPDHEEEASS